jgi:hypothetical protein
MFFPESNFTDAMKGWFDAVDEESGVGQNGRVQQLRLV